MKKNIRKPHVDSFSDSFVYISGDREFLTGEEAEKKIVAKNEQKNFRGGVGVMSVGRERWDEAQEFEEKTWMRDQRGAKEDRNSLYTPHFDGYAQLRGKHFVKAIELGCGPFTNIRHIARYVNIDEIHLLDPLIEKYVQHPHCAYKKGFLKIKKRVFGEKKKVILHPSSIEDFEIGDTFDLVIMMNVIEHCFNLNTIFNKVYSLLAPGGYLVFYDKYFLPDEIQRDIEKKYDAGHPLRVAGAVLDDFLKKNFETLFYKLNQFSFVRRGLEVFYRGMYFIGRKTHHSK